MVEFIPSYDIPMLLVSVMLSSPIWLYILVGFEIAVIAGIMLIVTALWMD